MTSQQEFWDWFIKNEDRLFAFEEDRETIFDEVSERLANLDSDLTFEFGPLRAGTREFVISAGGIKRAFQAVINLVSVAPELSRWKLIAFRPRRRTLNTIEFRGKRIDPDQAKVTLLHNGKLPGIYLFLPGSVDTDPDLRQIGYLMLDEVLGEYDVETKLGLIKMLPIEANSAGEKISLRELPYHFDKLVEQLKVNATPQSNY